MPLIAEKTVGRLTLYHRVLREMLADQTISIYSHELARASGVSAAQVRRDLMSVGYDGKPTKGYDVRRLVAGIEEVIYLPGGQRVALVGVGNVGLALLSFFGGRMAGLTIAASFDKDPDKAGRVIRGVRCHAVRDMREVLDEKEISVAILAVPVDVAQETATQLVGAGVRGILNFAPLPLHTPPHVYVENIDLTMALEKVAFFSRQEYGKKEAV